MTRYLLTAITAAALALSASAHFVFIVPAKDAKTIQVVMSEVLEPDDQVGSEKFTAIKLSARTADGKVISLSHQKKEHELVAEVPADARLIYGSVPYGVMQKGDAKPYLLAYHPKAVLASCDEKLATLGSSAAAEVVPTGTNGKMMFTVLAAGKPVADAEVNLILPDGAKEKVKTNAQGQTKAFAASGRYGLWVKVNETKTGDLDGKKYEEIRHYATLVIDVK